jgi:hypothetical protein
MVWQVPAVQSRRSAHGCPLSHASPSAPISAHFEVEDTHFAGARQGGALLVGGAPQAWPTPARGAQTWSLSLQYDVASSQGAPKPQVPLGRQEPPPVALEQKVPVPQT